MSWLSPVKSNSNTSGYLKLISLVKQYPIIYDSRNDLILDSLNFRNNQKEINQSWDAIGSQLGISAGECKRRWKTLKETFLRVHKRNSNKSNVSKKKWIYEDAMSFLIDNSQRNIQAGHTSTEAKKSKNIEEPKLTVQQGTNSKNYVNEKNDIIEMDENYEEIEEGTVEYLELDMDSMDNSEYYIMDTSMTDKQSGENVIQLATALQPNQVIVNNKLVPKYITICNTPAPTSIKKSNFITTTPITSENNSNPELITNIVMDTNAHVNGDSIVKEEVKNNKRLLSVMKETSVNKETIRRINQLLQTPGNSDNIETFFEYMAQAVLELPVKLQTEVKMEICKIVSTAEIRYSVMKS